MNAITAMFDAGPAPDEASGTVRPVAFKPSSIMMLAADSAVAAATRAVGQLVEQDFQSRRAGVGRTVPEPRLNATLPWGRKINSEVLLSSQGRGYYDVVSGRPVCRRQRASVL